MGVEVGHFWNAGRILPTRIGGIDIQHTRRCVKCKVHEWTRDIELLVDNLYGAEESRKKHKPKAGKRTQSAYRLAEKHGTEEAREREREQYMDYSSHGPKLGQRETESRRSLELQHANIRPWQ